MGHHPTWDEIIITLDRFLLILSQMCEVRFLFSSFYLFIKFSLVSLATNVITVIFFYCKKRRSLIANGGKKLANWIRKYQKLDLLKSLCCCTQFRNILVYTFSVCLAQTKSQPAKQQIPAAWKLQRTHLSNKIVIQRSRRRRWSYPRNKLISHRMDCTAIRLIDENK